MNMMSFEPILSMIKNFWKESKFSNFLNKKKPDPTNSPTYK